MDEWARRSCGERAAVQTRDERFAGTNWADFPLHDHSKMSFPYSLSISLSLSLSLSLSMSATLSSKVFYLLLHQPVSPGWLVREAPASSRMTQLGGGAHTVNECVLVCVYKQTHCVCVCVCVCVPARCKIPK